MTHDVISMLLRHDFNFFPWAHQENNDNCEKEKKKQTNASLVIMVIIGLRGV